jgi:hypothetical protein
VSKPKVCSLFLIVHIKQMDPKNPFTKMEIAFKHQLNTLTDAEQFREFLQSQKEFVYQYFQKDDPGQTHYRVLKEIILKPALFKIFLEEGYGVNTFRPLLVEILRSDQVESLKIFFAHPPYQSRLKLRSSLYSLSPHPYIHEDFADLLRYAGQNTISFLLDQDAMKENLTLDRFMELTPTISKERILQILRHKTYKHYLYGITTPYDWADSLHGRLWGTSMLPKKYQPNNRNVYKHVQEAFMEERTYRINSNWTYLFFCILLRARIREFVERFWAPGNKKSLELKNQFYNSIKKIETADESLKGTS